MKKITLIGLAMLMIISCKKEKNCPAFSQNDLFLLPYNEDDTVVFQSYHNPSFSIIIQQLIQSSEYTETYQSLLNLKKEACINYAELMATGTGKEKPYVFLRLEQSDVSDMQYYKYTFKDFYFEIDFKNEVPYANDFDQFDVVNRMAINEKEYREVVVYKDIQDESKEISTIYLTRSDGIIQFIDDKQNTWVLK